MHKEVNIIQKDADTAVLFIHGILGTPRHFDFLLPLLPGTWSRRAILLPGHGGSCRDFARSSMEEWKACCEKAFTELAAEHERVLLVGHSMGTLLSVYLAEKYPEKVGGIFALAMPLCPHFTPVAMGGCLHGLFCSPERDTPYQRSVREACSISLSKNLFVYLGWIPRYLELFALCRDTRKRMPTLKTPCTAIQSRKDELVAFRSAKLTGTAKTLVLPHSRHYFYSERDLETIKVEFGNFVSING